MPPLVSYESDDEIKEAQERKLTNSQVHLGANHTDHKMSTTSVGETVVIDTDLGPRYSRKAIEVAQAVKTLQGKLGKFSLRKVHEAILNGSVIVPETLTRAQILTADEILGTDVEYKQGIYTEKTQNQNSEKTDPSSNDIALEMDLIFDENPTMLISLGLPSNFTMILSVKDKSFESCQPAVDKMIAMHKILGKTVVEIKVDDAKMNDHLLRQSINVTKLSRNNHGIPHLDRKIRTIKDHIRIIRLMTSFACGGFQSTASAAAAARTAGSGSKCLLRPRLLA